MKYTTNKNSNHYEYCVLLVIGESVSNMLQYRTTKNPTSLCYIHHLMKESHTKGKAFLTVDGSIDEHVR